MPPMQPFDHQFLKNSLNSDGGGGTLGTPTSSSQVALGRLIRGGESGLHRERPGVTSSMGPSISRPVGPPDCVLVRACSSVSSSSLLASLGPHQDRSNDYIM